MSLSYVLASQVTEYDFTSLYIFISKQYDSLGFLKELCYDLKRRETVRLLFYKIENLPQRQTSALCNSHLLGWHTDADKADRYLCGFHANNLAKLFLLFNGKMSVQRASAYMIVMQSIEQIHREDTSIQVCGCSEVGVPIGLIGGDYQHLSNAFAESSVSILQAYYLQLLVSRYGIHFYALTVASGRRSSGQVDSLFYKRLIYRLARIPTACVATLCKFLEITSRFEKFLFS